MNDFYALKMKLEMNSQNEKQEIIDDICEQGGHRHLDETDSGFVSGADGDNVTDGARDSA